MYFRVAAEFLAIMPIKLSGSRADKTEDLLNEISAFEAFSSFGTVDALAKMK